MLQIGGNKDCNKIMQDATHTTDLTSNNKRQSRHEAMKAIRLTTLSTYKVTNKCYSSSSGSSTGHIESPKLKPFSAYIEKGQGVNIREQTIIKQLKLKK